MESLTKENFFNELTEQYPNAMVQFKDWIDKYKDDHNWDVLFGDWALLNAEMNRDALCGDIVEAPKFHEIPYEMQVGILLLFACHNMPDGNAGEFVRFFNNQFTEMFKLTLKSIEDAHNKNSAGNA